MKNRFTPSFISALGVSALALLSQSAQSQSLVYDDTASYSGANYNFDVGGAGSESAGQEVVIASGASITQFQVQIDLSGTGTPTGTIDVAFYGNTGGLTYNGYGIPQGTALWDSGTTPLSAIGFTSGGGSTLTYSVPSVAVPSDFTYIVTFSGLTPTETGGLSIYGGATTGANFHDAWVNTSGSYVLQSASSGFPPLEFGATLTATPEPSTIALGVMGACAFIARRRKS